MKKNLAFLCAAVLLLGLAGCGGAGGEQADDNYSKKAFVTVESDLYGWGFTNGGTCIPRESDNDVTYEPDTAAVMTVALADGSAPDPAKLDTTNACVTLEEGDGYYPEDFVFSGTALGGEFENGQLAYHLHDGDLTWVNDPSYEVKLGGLEWSAQGGDGNGLYTFNLSVRGITYDGKELAPAMFRARVYIFGREFSMDNALWGAATINKLKFREPHKTALAKDPEVGKDPVWTWVSAAGYKKPTLCDYPQEGYDADDYFFIHWPAGVDASGLTAEDFTITLENGYTEIFPEDRYVLKPNTGMVELPNGEQMPDGDFTVFADPGSTQISVNMVYWPYAPVFTKMTISVDGSKVSGFDGTLERSWDIDSVFTYRVQTGGGSRTDGTVTCQSIFGVANIHDITIDDLANINGAYSYSHSNDGEKSWLIENPDGSFTVTTDESQATVYDFTDPQLLGHVLYSTQYQVQVEVNGETVTYKMEPACTVRRAEPGNTALEPMDGFALSQAVGGWGDHMNWPWLNFLNLGWTPSN